MLNYFIIRDYQHIHDESNTYMFSVNIHFFINSFINFMKKIFKYDNFENNYYDKSITSEYQ